LRKPLNGHPQLTRSITKQANLARATPQHNNAIVHSHDAVRLILTSYEFHVYPATRAAISTAPYNKIVEVYCSMLLTVRNLAKSYGVIRVLSDISFVVNARDRIGIVGPNGVGKSTLLRLLTEYKFQRKRYTIDRAICGRWHLSSLLCNS
jgi:ABC-type molybdenum transport system ATPase subunit/photorepair protein PhrA